jgi:PKD repeat protein
MKALIGVTSNEAHVYDLVTGATLTTLTGRAKTASWSADGSHILTGSGIAARHWNATTGVEIRRLTGFEGDVLRAVISPDGTRAITVSDEALSLRIWDLSSGTQILGRAGERGSVSGTTWSPDETQVLSFGTRNARLRSVATGADLAGVQIANEDDTILAGAFVPDGPRLISSDDGEIHLWNTSTGAMIGTFSGHTSDVLSATLSTDGAKMATDSISTGREIPLSVHVADDEGDPIDVVWSFGDGTTATGLDVTHTWTERGVFQVCVTASDGATRVMSTREVSIGKPKQMAPRLKIRLDFKNQENDRLDLKLKAPFDMPVGSLPSGMILEVDVVSVRDESELHIATVMHLDDEGRAADGESTARLRRVSGSDLWKLNLALRSQSFETDGVPAAEGDWSHGKRTRAVPVTIRVRIDGVTVWTTSAEFRYAAVWRKMGKLRK